MRSETYGLLATFLIAGFSLLTLGGLIALGQRAPEYLGPAVVDASEPSTTEVEGIPISAALPMGRPRSVSQSEAAIAASTVSIAITESGFEPPVVTVTVGTAVMWTNYLTETVHLMSEGAYRVYLPLVLSEAEGLVVRNVGGAAAVADDSPGAVVTLQQDTWGDVDIAPGASYTHTFATVGNYLYFLSTGPRFTGRVTVNATTPGDTTPPPPVQNQNCVVGQGTELNDLRCSFITGDDDPESGTVLIALEVSRDYQGIMGGSNVIRLAELGSGSIQPGKEQWLIHNEDTDYNPILSTGEDWFWVIATYNGAGLRSWPGVSSLYFKTVPRAYVEHEFPIADVYLAPWENHDLLHGNSEHGIPDYSFELAEHLINGKVIPDGPPWSDYMTAEELANWLKSCDFATDLDPFHLARNNPAVFFYYQGGSTGESFYDIPTEDFDAIIDLLSGPNRFLETRVANLSDNYSSLPNPNYPQMGYYSGWGTLD